GKSRRTISRGPHSGFTGQEFLVSPRLLPAASGNPRGGAAGQGRFPPSGRRCPGGPCRPPSAAVPQPGRRTVRGDPPPPRPLMPAHRGGPVLRAPDHRPPPPAPPPPREAGGGAPAVKLGARPRAPG